jgi:L-lysine exporter family protein LysE/ArgO
MFTALLHGIILAFGLILPLGAQNVFIFNQGASQPHFRRAIPVILTASICDTILIALAIVGVSVIVLTLPILQSIIFAIGIIFLLFMGWTIWNSKLNVAKKESALPTGKQIMFALSVSLLNPHAILDTIGVIGTSSLSYTGSEKWAFALACIGISWLWFFSLAFLGKVVGEFDTEGKWLKLINKLSAIIIWGVAIYITSELYKIIDINL